LALPTYLFEFKSGQELTSYFVIIADISTFKDRFNEFVFTEGIDDALNGKLILGAAGFYSYDVYEQTSTTNLDPTTLTDALVESGIMKLDRGNQDYNTHIITETYNTHTVS